MDKKQLSSLYGKFANSDSVIIESTGFDAYPYESTILTECGIRLAIFRQSGLVIPELRFSKQFHETAYAVFRWHDQDMKWIQVSNWFSRFGWCENRMAKLAVKYDLSVYNQEG